MKDPFDPTNFYERIDVNKICNVPTSISNIKPQWRAMFSDSGLLDSKILVFYELTPNEAIALAAKINAVVAEIREMEITHSRFIRKDNEEYIHVEPFFLESAPIVEKLKIATIDAFSQYKDDRGFHFLTNLAHAPVFADNGVLGKDIASIQWVNAAGQSVTAFSIKPSGPPLSLPPYPSFSSGTHTNGLALRRYSHLFERYQQANPTRVE